MAREVVSVDGRHSAFGKQSRSLSRMARKWGITGDEIIPIKFTATRKASGMTSPGEGAVFVEMGCERLGSKLLVNTAKADSPAVEYSY